MTRRKQVQARAAARARDGSVPVRRAGSVASSSARGMSIEPNHLDRDMADVKVDQAEDGVGLKRAAEDDGDEDGGALGAKRPRTAGSASLQPSNPSASTQGRSSDTRREQSIVSDIASWVRTPEPAEGALVIRANAQLDQQQATGAFPSAARAVKQNPPHANDKGTESRQRNGANANGYKQRGSTNAVAGPSNYAQAPARSNAVNRLRKGKGKMKPLSLAGHVYTPIPMLERHKMFNIVGALVSYRLPNKSVYGTGDYSMNFFLVDSWCYNTDCRVSINMFSKQAADLPSHIATGTVVLLRQVKTKDFQSTRQGVCYKDKLAWATLGLDGKYQQLPGMVVHPAEREHMQDLSQWYAETYLGQVENVQNSTLKTTVTLDQVQDGVFCHCIAEVVRTFGHDDRPEIYITDWTSNDDLLAVNNKDIGWKQEDLDRLEQQRGDNGGGSVLKITLWDEQIKAVLALQPGNMVHIRNLRCKRAAFNMLEGTIGGSRTQRDFKENKWQIQKLKKSDKLLEPLLERKKNMLHELEMSRAIHDWPESGESASRIKEEIKSPVAGGSGHAQNPESYPSANMTDTSSKKAETTKNGGGRGEAADENAVTADEATPPSSGVVAKARQMESITDSEASPARKVLALTATAAQVRAQVAMRFQEEGIHVEDNKSDRASQEDENAPRAKVGKGKARQVSVPVNSQSITQSSSGSSATSPAMAVVALPRFPPPPPLSSADESPSPEQKVVPLPSEQSTGSTLSSSGTPSVMYSLPPPGQRPFPTNVPSSSFPSTSQSAAGPAHQPVSSTPLVQMNILEERDSDLDSSDDEMKHKQALQQRQQDLEQAKRRAQERADQIVSCRASVQKVFKMSDIAAGKGIDAKHHVRVRIVDTIPRDISRWVRVSCTNCKRTLPDSENFCAPCADEEGTHLKHEWMFALVIQDEGADAQSSVPVIVAADEANAFLSGFDPAKHRRDVKAQRKLRERLAPIFGSAIEGVDPRRRRSDSSTDRGAEGSKGKDKLEAAQLENPLVDLGVYAFRCSNKGKIPADQPGAIKCKLYGTKLQLTSRRS